MEALAREPVTGEQVHRRVDQVVEAALRYRRDVHWYGDEAWKLNLRLIRGDQWNRGPFAIADGIEDLGSLLPQPDGQVVTVNRVGSYFRDQASSLTQPHYTFTADPTRPEFVDKVGIKAALLNQAWKGLQMHDEWSQAVLDGIAVGHGVIRTGYTLEVDLDRTKDPKRRGAISYDDYVRKDQPYIKRVNPFMFLWDYTAPDRTLKTARWCAELFGMPLQDLIDNEKFDSSVRRKIATGSYTVESFSTFYDKVKEFDTGSYSQSESVEDTGTVHSLLFHYWDKRQKIYRIYAKGVPEPLYERPWPYTYLDGFPYVIYTYLRLPDELFGVGLPYWMRDQQHELNDIRTTEFRVRQQFKEQRTAINSRLVTTETMAQLRGNDQFVVFGGRPEDAVGPLFSPDIDAKNFQVESIINRDLQDAAGSDALMQGQELPDRTSASEIQARTQISGMKAAGVRTNTKQFLLAVATQVIRHIEANVSRPQVVRVAGTLGSRFETMTPEEIRSPVDLNLTAAPEEEQSKERTRSERLAMFDKISQQLEVWMKMGLDPKEFFKWVLQAFGDHDAARFFPSLNTLSPPIGPALEQEPAAPEPTPDGDESPLSPDALALRQGAVNPNSALQGAINGGVNT